MWLSLLAGLGLGLALIVPIGPQNIYVINSGIWAGFPRVFVAIAAATLCDWLLISVGALGGAAVIAHIPGAQVILLIFGTLFLLYLGIVALRSNVPEGALNDTQKTGSRQIIKGVVGVSLLNPHAILDTTVVIGSAIAGQEASLRLYFALGALSASLLWFLFLGIGASCLRDRLTYRMRVLIERLSGVILLLFALKLFLELI